MYRKQFSQLHQANNPKADGKTPSPWSYRALNPQEQKGAVGFAGDSASSPDCCSSPSKWGRGKALLGFTFQAGAPRKGKRHRKSPKWHLLCLGGIAASELSWECCEEPREPLGRLAEPTDGGSWGWRTREKGKKNNPLQTFSLSSLIWEVE